MCADIAKQTSYYAVSLTTDDELSGNLLYLPWARSLEPIMLKLLAVAGGVLLILVSVLGCANGGNRAISAGATPPVVTPSASQAVEATTTLTGSSMASPTAESTPVDLYQAALGAVYGGPVPIGACFSSGTGELPGYTPEEYQDVIDAAGGIDRFIGPVSFAGSPEALAAASEVELIGYDDEAAWLLLEDSDGRRAEEWSRRESADGTDVWRRTGTVSNGDDCDPG